MVSNADKIKSNFYLWKRLFMIWCISFRDNFSLSPLNLQLYVLAATTTAPFIPLSIWIGIAGLELLVFKSDQLANSFLLFRVMLIYSISNYLLGVFLGTMIDTRYYLPSLTLFQDLPRRLKCFFFHCRCIFIAFSILETVILVYNYF